MMMEYPVQLTGRERNTCNCFGPVCREEWCWPRSTHQASNPVVNVQRVPIGGSLNGPTTARDRLRYPVQRRIVEPQRGVQPEFSKLLPVSSVHQASSPAMSRGVDDSENDFAVTPPYDLGAISNDLSRPFYNAVPRHRMSAILHQEEGLSKNHHHHNGERQYRVEQATSIRGSTPKPYNSLVGPSLVNQRAHRTHQNDPAGDSGRSRDGPRLVSSKSQSQRRGGSNDSPMQYSRTSASGDRQPITGHRSRTGSVSLVNPNDVRYVGEAPHEKDHVRKLRSGRVSPHEVPPPPTVHGSSRTRSASLPIVEDSDRIEKLKGEVVTTTHARLHDKARNSRNDQLASPPPAPTKVPRSCRNRSSSLPMVEDRESDDVQRQHTNFRSSSTLASDDEKRSSSRHRAVSTSGAGAEDATRRNTPLSYAEWLNRKMAATADRKPANPPPASTLPSPGCDVGGQFNVLWCDRTVREVADDDGSSCSDESDFQQSTQRCPSSRSSLLSCRGLKKCVSWRPEESLFQVHVFNGLDDPHDIPEQGDCT